jgi:hypothetical protein
VGMKRISFLFIVIIMIAVMPALIYAEIKTAVLQPGPGLNDGTDEGGVNAGKDTANYPFNAATNYGDATYLSIYNSPCNITGGISPGYLRFCPASLPTQNIITATIEVYAYVYFNGNGWHWPVGTYDLSLHQISAYWNEMQVTFNNRPAYDAAIIDSNSITTTGGGSAGNPFVEFEGWLSFDVTDLYKGWVDGTIPNYGVAFVLDDSFCANGDQFYLYTSDYTDDITLRPKLVVTYNQEECETPTAPTGMAARAKSSTQVVLGWNYPFNDETGFNIEKKTGGCGSTNTWTQIATKSENTTTHTVAGLSPNTTYAFRISAANECGVSSASNCVTAKTAPAGSPPSPSNLKAGSASSTKVKLTWSDGSTNENGFRVFRRAGTGPWTRIAQTGPGIVSFSDTTANNNPATVSYQYYITAYNASGSSVSTYTATVPYQPTNLSAVPGAASGAVNVSWTDNSNNETGFEIYRKTGTCASTSTWAKVATVAANKTTWTDNGRTPGNQYSYKVRAYKKTGAVLSAYGYSLFSNCASATAP